MVQLTGPKVAVTRLCQVLDAEQTWRPRLAQRGTSDVAPRGEAQSADLCRSPECFGTESMVRAWAALVQLFPLEFPNGMPRHCKAKMDTGKSESDHHKSIHGLGGFGCERSTNHTHIHHSD